MNGTFFPVQCYQRFNARQKRIPLENRLNEIS